MRIKRHGRVCIGYLQGFECCLHSISAYRSGAPVFFINKNSYVERLISEGVFEIKRTDYIFDLIKSGDVFVDIGANIGYFSVFAARLGAVVYAFEPEPVNYSRLTKNVKLNGFSDGRVTCFRKALGDTRAESWLNRPLNDNFGRASLLSVDSSDRVKVDVERLDSLIAPDARRHVFKIDVEGFEVKVLEGAIGLHSRLCGGSMWIVEVHVGTGVDKEWLENYYKNYGYHCKYFDDENGTVGECKTSGDVMLIAEKC